MELEVPEGMELEIISNLASVYGRGTYKNMLVQLKSGSCFLKDFTGNAMINTFTGNIDIETKNARIIASSRQDKVRIAAFNLGTYKIKLTSISGNISVQKMN